MLSYLRQHPQVLYLTCAILLIWAYLTNLGQPAIMMDEPTRALVALEMIFSDNYVTPTIFGEFYYNKPPLYNWILISFFQLTGSFSEFVVRLPALIPLFLFGFTIYEFIRRELGWQIGALTAIMFMTCGRMLIVSSMIGHIDIFFSWITFISFITVWHYGKQEKWLPLFLITYLLTSIGFLSKGLPSIVFQGLTLIGYLTYQKKFKLLFSWQHIVSGLLCLAIIGAYFWAYSKYNSLETYLPTLWNESSKRTVLQRNFFTAIAHFFKFPFETLYHLVPWSILVFYTLSRDIWQKFLNHPFLKFNLIMLGANVIPYWLSPGTHPRYIFMLFPLLFTLFAYAYFQRREEASTLTRIIDIIFISGSILMSLAIWIVPFIDDLSAMGYLKGVQEPQVFEQMPFAWLKIIFLSAAMLFLSWLMIKLPKHRLILFASVLMCFRLGFDWFVITHRAQTGAADDYRDFGLRVAEITKGEALYLQDGFTFNHDLTYYISRERGEILRKTTRFDMDAYYLCTDICLDEMPYESYFDFYTRHDRRPVKLVKFLKE